MSLTRLSRPALAARKSAEEVLGRRLSSAVGRPVRVVLTRNRKRLLSLRSGRGGSVLRMHSALEGAEADEIEVLAAWVLGKPGSQEASRTLLARHAERIDAVSATTLRPPRAAAQQGRHHDLLSILGELKAAHFPQLPDVYVAWSGRQVTARRRRLGSWHPRARLVRIHCRLDSARVPRYFLASIVHHELCHAACDPSRTPTGRRRVHGPEFRALDARFADGHRARAWEQENLAWLLGDD
jgi:predicted metal-dependent hydrolase